MFLWYLKQLLKKNVKSGDVQGTYFFEMNTLHLPGNIFRNWHLPWNISKNLTWLGNISGNLTLACKYIKEPSNNLEIYQSNWQCLERINRNLAAPPWNTSRNLAISNISRCLASQTLKYYKEPGTYLEMFQRTQHWPGNKDDPGEISRIVV